MKKNISLCSLVLCVVSFSCGSVKDNQESQEILSSYVNPFIGASTSMDAGGSYHGLGKTFPGATAPFGMVQVSPNTITGGDNGSGYSDEHTSIEGFAFTQMSGIGWYGDLGNLLVMPTVVNCIHFRVYWTNRIRDTGPGTTSLRKKHLPVITL